eukprot:TRINITY_DN5989_c0_g2_i1.p1 TRINITY_DN5989_c0_g2~~TRINITY_DN5989_c0_g2_i1.p1  ORF type:complete len:205 (-),score=10.33 TRINITY_DN5989_c0_g2_i1:38-583(-)
MCIRDRSWKTECAACGRFMERNGGCSHMQCLCGYDFCWYCKHTYTDHSKVHCGFHILSRVLLYTLVLFSIGYKLIDGASNAGVLEVDATYILQVLRLHVCWLTSMVVCISWGVGLGDLFKSDLYSARASILFMRLVLHLILGVGVVCLMYSSIGWNTISVLGTAGAFLGLRSVLGLSLIHI